MASPEKAMVSDALRLLQAAAHRDAEDAGVWDTHRSDHESLMAAATGLTKASTALRTGNPMSDDFPGLRELDASLAMTVLVLLDYAEARSIDLGEAITLMVGDLDPGLRPKAYRE